MTTPMHAAYTVPTVLYIIVMGALKLRQAGGIRYQLPALSGIAYLMGMVHGSAKIKQSYQTGMGGILCLAIAV
jgi:hypothetical protein